MPVKTLLVALFALSAAGALRAEDSREGVVLPAPAQAVLRREMLDNLLAINDIVTLLAEGKPTEAGAVAEEKLGLSAMGKNRALPLEARPGAHMPLAMREAGIAGHKAASEFAKVAAGGDGRQALARLPAVTGACVACHFAYRLR